MSANVTQGGQRSTCGQRDPGGWKPDFPLARVVLTSMTWDGGWWMLSVAGSNEWMGEMGEKDEKVILLRREWKGSEYVVRKRVEPRGTTQHHL